MREREGFTLVELLVVIAIIGLLVAILLPAVQAARASARKAQCSNNFRQVALATLNYESATNHLPALVDTRFRGGTRVFRNGHWRGKPRFVGWRMRLLPYVEEHSLDERLAAGTWEHEIYLDPPAQQPSRPAVIASLLCPATPGTPNLTTTDRAIEKESDRVVFDAFASKQVSAIGWVFTNAGSDQGAEQGAWMGTTRPFSFAEASTTSSPRVEPAKLRWVTGGLSKTLLVVEKAGLPLRIHGADQRLNDTHSASWTRGSGVGHAENLYMRHDNHFSGVPLSGAVNFSNTAHPFSFHPGGAHASRCDGSIRFLPEDTSVEILFALATRENVDFAD